MFKLSGWIATLLSVAIFVVAAYGQHLLDGAVPGSGFVILIAAVTVVAFLSGSLAGVAAVVVGAFLTLHEPLRAPGLGPLRADDITRAALFVIVAGVDIVIVQALNSALLEARALTEATFGTLEGQQTLFQELQHRVANNIQFVASLLTMHRNVVTHDPAAAVDALDAARTRLTNVARVHRRLSDPQGFAMPPRLYLEELCGDLVAGFPVNVVCTVDPGLPTLTPNKLVTLSLVIAEAVTNALKHAFPGPAMGTIAVDILREGSESATLAIRDNGIGLPADFKAGQRSSLGLRILDGLVHQLDGTLHIEGDKGTTVRVRFKL